MSHTTLSVKIDEESELYEDFETYLEENEMRVSEGLRAVMREALWESEEQQSPEIVVGNLWWYRWGPVLAGLLMAVVGFVAGVFFLGDVFSGLLLGVVAGFGVALGALVTAVYLLLVTLVRAFEPAEEKAATTKTEEGTV